MIFDLSSVSLIWYHNDICSKVHVKKVATYNSVAGFTFCEMNTTNNYDVT